MAQKITLVKGDASVLKNEKTITTKFTYDSMSVGKFDKEADYVDQKKEDYNKKEAGKGDQWAKAWVNDRESRFEPRFNEKFTESTGISVSAQPAANYTLIFHTTFTEPGFSAGWPVHKNALVTGTATLVETAHPSNIIAVYKVENAPGRLGIGFDFDTGVRIQEAYAMAGRELGKKMVH